MFIVLLRFTDNKTAAAQHMPGHGAWIRQGIADDVFLLAGTIKPGLGGAVLAHNCTLTQLQQRVAADPFVAEKVVDAEIIDVSPGMTDDRLSFLAT